MAAAIAAGLRRDGYGVDVAYDGVEALHLACSRDYDAVVLDILLPGLSGYEVLRRLRAADVWTSVLMVSAKDGEYDQADALDLGADDYLTKPVSYVVLHAHLRALFRRGARARPAVLLVADLSFDPATRRCCRGASTVTLTARESAVLEYLARRGGEVVSKRELLEHVWDETFAGDPNIVEVYVLRLRRKIDVPFQRPLLHTLRGAGYRLGP